MDTLRVPLGHSFGTSFSFGFSECKYQVWPIQNQNPKSVHNGKHEHFGTSGLAIAIAIAIDRS